MSVETDVKLTLKAEDQASTVVRALRAEVDLLRKSVAKLAKLNVPGIQAATKANIAPKAAGPFRLDPRAAAALKTQFQAEAGIARQRERQAVAEDRQRRQFESAAIRDLRTRMATTARMARQRLAEISAAERATKQAADAAERDAASTLRRQIAGDRWRFQLRNRMDRQERTDRERARKETIGRGRDAWQHGRNAVRDTTRPAGVAALAGSAAAGAAARKILGAESSIDSAEINTRIYGRLDQDAARRLRDDWASPLAESLGSQTDKLLTAWVDATKLGIPAAGAKAFAELSTKTSEAWSVPFEAVTDILGTVNTLLTSKGEAFSADRLRSVANTVQHLAAKQSTTPEKLMSYLQRGAGAAQVLGMSQEAGLAFGSASTSLGNQAGQSGRMFDYIASRVIEMPRLTKQTGDTGHVEWLPKVGALVAALRVTREEVRHLDLRGWTSIDPVTVEERREADRVRKRAARAAAGATPREQSAARTEPWKALGLTKRTWQRRKSAGTLQRGAISSAPPVNIYGPDESAPLSTVLLAANDDMRKAHLAA